MYYSFNDQKRSSVRSVRINNDLLEKAEEYAQINPDFNINKFVNDQLFSYFFDDSFINKRIAHLKRMLQKEQKNLRDLEKNPKKSVKFKAKEIKDFLSSLDHQKKAFFNQSIKILERDGSYLMGRFNLYKNTIDGTVTKRDFTKSLNLYQAAIERDYL